jgi:hypothetical protein
MVRRLTPAPIAKRACDQPSRRRAALICSGVTILDFYNKAQAHGRGGTLLAEIGRGVKFTSPKALDVPVLFR